MRQCCFCLPLLWAQENRIVMCCIEWSICEGKSGQSKQTVTLHSRTSLNDWFRGRKVSASIEMDRSIRILYFEVPDRAFLRASNHYFPRDKDREISPKAKRLLIRQLFTQRSKPDVRKEKNYFSVRLELNGKEGPPFQISPAANLTTQSSGHIVYTGCVIKKGR